MKTSQNFGPHPSDCYPSTSLRSPRFGVGERASPRFILSICSDLRSLFSGVQGVCSDVFQFAPSSSVLFRFVSQQNQNQSGKPLSADPLILQGPDLYDSSRLLPLGRERDSGGWGGVRRPHPMAYSFQRPNSVKDLREGGCQRRLFLMLPKTPFL